MKLFRIFVIAILVLLFFSSIPFAQSIKVGTWTGTMTPPNGETSDVKYEVEIIGDSLSITLISAAMGNFPLQDIQLEKGKLVFSWNPGLQIDCSLNLQNDGRYEGQCIDANEGKGKLTMVPPKG